MFQLVSCSFSTIPICPFLIQRIFPFTCNMMAHKSSCCTTCTGAVVWAGDELFAWREIYTPTCGMEELRKLNAQEPAEIPAR